MKQHECNVKLGGGGGRVWL